MGNVLEGTQSVEGRAIPEVEFNLIRTIKFAAHHSPFYSAQAWAEKVRAGQGVRLADLPITAKAEFKGQNLQFFCDNVPLSEGPVYDRRTSGSTGEPSKVRRTETDRHFNLLENNRLIGGWGAENLPLLLQVWATHDPAERGTLTKARYKSGYERWTLQTTDTNVVARVLQECRAPALSCYPSTAIGLLEDSSEFDFLRLLHTVSEAVPARLKELVAELPNCRHYDEYSSEETGIVAGLCAQCGDYHVASNHAVIEILDDSGRPAEPGTLGRVVVTPIYNLAMPLLRYDIGDAVVMAEPGGCPISPTALKSIAGREQDLFHLPTGGKITPVLRLQANETFRGLKKYKLFQTAIDQVELHYVMRSPELEISKAAFQKLVDDNLGHHFTVTPVRVDEIPLSGSGKYRMHECLL